ncbi:MAG TPA: UDP-2,3-diacylglucosamine diphosphatase [Saprospiraceae bacterium]|nr:UDP-2,3-diacylglucosamine diphosphatase [Saprospiraceae bacterium]
MKRNLDICVLSDFHLGTYGCRSEELLQYLHSIEPARLILNGDIFDAWQFKKKYFPPTHWEIIERILQMANTGTIVYYLTGNHDGIMRRFNSLDMGNIRLRNQLELRIQNKTYWFFHGDIFDASVLISPRLAALGGRGYDWLIRLNAWINRWRTSFGYSKISFAHKVKHSVKHAVKFVTDFEKQAIEIGLKKGVDAVICGHIHQPCIQLITKEKKEITYMNSGDWIENLSALEYKGGKWRLFRYNDPIENDLEEFLTHLEDDQYIFPEKRTKAPDIRDFK